MNEILFDEAFAKMKELQHGDETFEMHFFGLNRTRGESGGLKKYFKCRLRPALPKEFSEIILSDTLLPFKDVDNDENKHCYKRLIRFVAFPPEYELLKIKRK
ncbi:MAG: hypothetical protein PF448_13090 [Bacteroidales bacterium]|jgi:hypothetical protein|nr:hypothetical protein [Bacteroidales bacterium]